MTGNANNARRLHCWASCQPVESLLNVCWSTMKLHTTPSLLRPRAKPFPLRTMSKDSAGMQTKGQIRRMHCICLELPVAPVGNCMQWGAGPGQWLHCDFYCKGMQGKQKCRKSDFVFLVCTRPHLWFHTRIRRKKLRTGFLLFTIHWLKWHTLFIRASLCSWTCCLWCIKRFACWLVGWRPGGHGSTAAQDKSNHTRFYGQFLTLFFFFFVKFWLFVRFHVLIAAIVCFLHEYKKTTYMIKLWWLQSYNDKNTKIPTHYWHTRCILKIPREDKLTNNHCSHLVFTLVWEVQKSITISGKPTSVT